MKSMVISVLILVPILSETQVAAPSIVIAHPGQDVELLCDVTPSGNESVAWVINGMRPYEINAIHGGIVSGYANDLGSNNLLVTSIMMDDDRNDTEHQCVIGISGVLQNTLQLIERGNVSILYVAGVPAMIPDLTVDNIINVTGNRVTRLKLCWGEPFNNLDPIVNYTVSCSGDVTCPPTFNTTDNAIIFGNLTTMTTYTFSVVATNSIGSGEAGVVMITTPPGEAPNTTDIATTAIIVITTTVIADAATTTVVTQTSSNTSSQLMTDNETDNSGVVIAVVIVVVLLILVGCITMDILFCFCCKRKERYHQENGEDKMSHYCIIVLGISTLGTSVLLWWMYKYFSGKDKYNVEAHSAVPLSSTKSSKKDDHKDKDDYKRSVEYDAIAEATSIQGSPPAVSYAATTQALSKDTNTGPALQYDYARTGPLKIADDTTQQSIPAKPVEESYAVSDIVKDKKKDKKEKADTKNQRLLEYAAVDKSKKKKKNGKQQMDEQDIQQPQMAGHKQKTELNYMDPSNLEFTKEPHNSARKRETDQTVQYGNLAETPQYTNVM